MAKKTLHTPLGSLVLTEANGFLTQAEWSNELFTDASFFLQQAEEEVILYLNGKLRAFSVPCDLKHKSPFLNKVWQAIADIPYGVTRTYGDIAEELSSHPRPVGTACRKNPLALFIPCHRVVGKNHTLTGYNGGTDTKRKLLSLEANESIKIEG
mgnify:CR=1 FL=1